MDIKLHNELPVEAMKDDLLGRVPLVEMIANAILTKAQTDHKCYTIGIYGRWGEGKTSVLNMLKSHLLEHKDDNIVISTFNPWILKDQESILIEFFNVLVKESILKKSVKKIKEYVAAISLGAGVISNMIIPASGKRVAKAARWFIDALPTFKQTVQERKEDISNIITESKKHILVLIDDVDRLDNTETHALLKLVRQVADFDNVIYVIAMDPNIVSKSISQYFGAGTYDDGRRFLEKIVQVPIVLPQIETEVLSKILSDKLTELFEAVTPIVDPAILQSVVKKIGNLFSSIRDVYRYINQLSLVLPSLYKEVNIVDLCMLEVVKMFSVNGYKMIYENRNVVLRKYSSMETMLNPSETLQKNNSDKMDTLINNILSDAPKMLSTRLQPMLEQELLCKDYRPELTKLIEQKRLCSDVYFDKYFMQCVPSNIIPDSFLDDHMDDIRNNNVARLTGILDELHNKYSFGEIKRATIYWIESYESDFKIRLQRAAVVCKALAFMKMNQDCEYSLMNIDGIGRYITNILIPRYMLSRPDDIYGSKEIDRKAVFDTSLHILKECPVQFVLTFFCYIRSLEILKNTQYLFSMFDIVHDRFFSAFDELEIFKYSGDIQHLFFAVWKGKNKDGFLSFIDKSLDNPKFPIIDFVTYHVNYQLGEKSCSQFIELFELKDKIAGRLKSVATAEDMQNPSIALFCNNCGGDLVA